MTRQPRQGVQAAAEERDVDRRFQRDLEEKPLVAFEALPPVPSSELKIPGVSADPGQQLPQGTHQLRRGPGSGIPDRYPNADPTLPGGDPVEAALRPAVCGVDRSHDVHQVGGAVWQDSREGLAHISSRDQKEHPWESRSLVFVKSYSNVAAVIRASRWPAGRLQAGNAFGKEVPGAFLPGQTAGGPQPGPAGVPLNSCSQLRQLRTEDLLDLSLPSCAFVVASELPFGQQRLPGLGEIVVLDQRRTGGPGQAHGNLARLDIPATGLHRDDQGLGHLGRDPGVPVAALQFCDIIEGPGGGENTEIPSLATARAMSGKAGMPPCSRSVLARLPTSWSAISLAETRPSLAYRYALRHPAPNCF